MGLFEKIFGTYSDKALKEIKPVIEKINSFEPTMKAKSDEELKEMTVLFRERLAAGETLDDILPEAFAVTREAAIRVMGQRHYDVQLIGGVVLHQGRIAEMKTGEGKTLVSTLPAYLNALASNGVHIVTVNDYLAKRDSEWMGKIFVFLGLTVGVIVHGLSQSERRAAYNCDITYATNNELGFDYLRDNMVTYKEQLAQRPLSFAIVDEVDSILIDEARTPLIISGAGEKSSDMYEKADAFACTLSCKMIKETDKKDLNEDVEEDFIVDEKAKSVSLTKHGIEKAEKWFSLENLSDPENGLISHHINQALKAHGIMTRDIDYVVRDEDGIVIVDEFTGRLMFGRRYSEGLHQAIEAKEHVKVEKESMTQATITFQNFFRMYKKLSGMTGTAQTEEGEFNDIYSLDVVVIPTNMPMIRVDYPDAVYKNVNGKYAAVVSDVEKCHQTGQPVLIGTISIEKSELLSKMLKRKGIPHNVLNAKNHEREAEIVAQAGKYGTVTIATNMAGRGTDIKLGGNAEYMAKQAMRKEGFDEETISLADSFADTDNQVILIAREKYHEFVKTYSEETERESKKVRDVGGLFIMGTERHESRRIDNQLRGRAGRQGDPGMSRFYISLEDDLMRLFGSEKISGMIEALGFPEDQPIEHKILSSAIENAQKKVEGRNFDIRRHVLQYDDVMNQQREIIYSERRKVLDGENLKDYYMNMVKSKITEITEFYCHKDSAKDTWNIHGISEDLAGVVMPEVIEEISKDIKSYKTNDIIDKLVINASERYEAREIEFGSDLMREIERVMLLRAVDENWMIHIDAIDQMKNGIGLRAYGNKDPLVEYKFESFEMFEEMNKTIQSQALRMIFTVRVKRGDTVERKRVAVSSNARLAGGDGTAPKAITTIKKSTKVGRNDACPCGSGKKYKNCCGRGEVND